MKTQTQSKKQLKSHLFITLTYLSVSLCSFVNASNNGLSENNKIKEIEAKNLISNQPVRFRENNGQLVDMDNNLVPFVLFSAEAKGVHVYITETGLTLNAIKIEEEEIKKEGTPEWEKDEEIINIEWERIDIELAGATIKKENVVKESPSSVSYNFFLPHCDEGLYGVKEYEKVTIKNVYPGIDWVLYNSNETGFKYDFIVSPGADYKQIELLYRSKNALELTEKGTLSLATRHGDITENNPTTFLNEEEVGSNFKKNYSKEISINGSQGYETSIGFHLQLGETERTEKLIIDPQLWWATYYGGLSVDGLWGSTTDNNGNFFVTGYVGSVNFPTQNAGTFFQGTKLGNKNDAFILKFSSTGVLLWATYYGGYENEFSISIATDNTGNVYITGDTQSFGFPVQNAGTFFQGNFAFGYIDAFIVKFDNNGNRLWATYYGGNGADRGNAIDTDSNGNVFVSGYTQSSNFPLQNSGSYFQGAGAGTNFYILKFDNLGNRLWASLFGGSGLDYSSSIAIDNNDDLYITGVTNSTDFPLQNSGAFFQSNLAGGNDAFIIKFSNVGNLLWSTYYGGSDGDSPTSIEASSAGDIILRGTTSSSDFPLQNAGTFFQGSKSIDDDSFLLKFDKNGNRKWATYLGGNGNELAWSYDNIVFSNCGNSFYVGFSTESTDMPMQISCDSSFQQSSNAGYRDIYLSMFDSVGNMLWATYVGGDGRDYRAAMAVDNNNDLFIAGEWVNAINSSSYPIANPGNGAFHDSTFHAGDDGYVMKFVMPNIGAGISSTDPSCLNKCGGEAEVTLTKLTNCNHTYLWSNGQTTATATGLCVGTHSVTVTNQWCKDTVMTVSLQINTDIAASAGQVTQVQCNGTATGVASVLVTGGVTPYAYNWNTGGTTSSITGLSVGIYSVTVTDAVGCTAIETMQITEPDSLELNLQTTPTYCQGSCSGQLSASASGGTPPYTYSWSNNGNLNYIDQLCAQEYGVTVTDANGCTISAIGQVEEGNGDLTALFSATPNITNVYETRIQFQDLSYADPAAWHWTFYNIDHTAILSESNTQHPEFQFPEEAGTYWVNLQVTSKEGCIADTAQTIEIKDIGSFFIPNAFTPQSDGLNDFFTAKGMNVEQFKMQVFDRWGELIFISEDINKGWDGTVNGNLVPNGVYVYKINYQLVNHGPEYKIGTVTLVY